MKRASIILTLVAIASVALMGQVNWQSGNGPWFALVDELAIGMKVDGSVVIYAADSAETSLMKSTDRGESWVHVFNVVPGYQRTVACDATNPDIVYTAVYSYGIFKSTDGGNSWTYLVSQPTNRRVNRIILDPANPEVLWVGCEQIYPTFPAVLYRSTNGGGEWIAMTIGAPNPNQISVSDIQVAQNSEYVWVSTHGGTPENTGVWRTLNGGVDWTLEIQGMDAGNLNVASLAVDYNDPDVLYAGNRFGNPVKLYKTVSGTSTCEWELLQNAPTGNFSFSDIKISNHDQKLIYVSTGLWRTGIGVLKSVDGGISWQTLANGIYAKELRAIGIDPVQPEILYAAGYGSCYRSDDAGLSWAWYAYLSGQPCSLG